MARLGRRAGLVVAVLAGALALSSCVATPTSQPTANAPAPTATAESGSGTARSPVSGKSATVEEKPVQVGSLTGFGATRESWDSSHTRDANPKLVAGCCYGPRIRFFGQSDTQDTWVAVLSEKEVYSFEHDFPPRTPERAATEQILSQDLPRDARLVRAAVGNGCKLFLYRSATLAREAPDLGAYISVSLVSPPDETVYFPTNIWSASVMSSANDLGTC